MASCKWSHPEYIFVPIVFYHDAYDIDIDVESDVVSFTDDIRVYTSRTF